MEIQLYSVQPSDRLAELLTAIDSAPALSSVTFNLFVGLAVFQSDIDKWLARLAGERNKAGAGLVVMVGPWPKENTVRKGYFPEFRKVGGELRVDLR